MLFLTLFMLFTIICSLETRLTAKAAPEMTVFWKVKREWFTAMKSRRLELTLVFREVEYLVLVIGQHMLEQLMTYYALRAERTL
jgi:hypothetical protein